MSDITYISGAEALSEALAKAIGGEIFVLFPSDYSDLALSAEGISAALFENPVTIRLAQGVDLPGLSAALADLPTLVTDAATAQLPSKADEAPASTSPFPIPPMAIIEQPAPAWAIAGRLEAGLPETVPAAGNGVIEVSDRASLLKALAEARGGETILLADGDYGHLGTGVDFPDNVTIAAAHPGAARFTSFLLDGASNLTFEGLVFDYEYDAGQIIGYRAFRMQNSEDLTFRNCVFDGDDYSGADAEAQGYPSGKGLTINGSSNILVEDSTVTGFWKGILISDSSGVVLRGNEITDIRSDGINIVDSAYVQVVGNWIHDFRTNFATGDHADMIQMYPSGKGLMPHDIVISGNYLDIGDGGLTQSIFLTHPKQIVGAFGGDPVYHNITVTENVIINGHSHGITLGKTVGLTVTNNTLLNPPGSGLPAPRIELDGGSRDVTLTGNVAHLITGTISAGDWSVGNNFLIQNASPGSPGYYADFLINAMTQTAGAPDNIQVLPDSEIALAGAGATRLIHDGETGSGLTALGYATKGEFRNEVIFDAGYSTGDPGIAAGTAHILWDFGDGTQAEGLVVSHVYARPGIYTAILRIETSGGQLAESRVTAGILGADVIRYDVGAGHFIRQAYGAESVFGTPAASTHLTGGDIAIRLDGGDRTEIGKGQIKELFSSEGFRIESSVRLEKGGELFRLHTSFTVSVNGKGELQMSITPEGGKTYAAATSGAHLLDGGWHDVTVSYDSSNGIALSVDGMLLAEVSASGALAPAASWGLWLGRSDSRSVTGEIRSFDLDVEPRHYAVIPGGGEDSPPAPLPSDPETPASELPPGMELGRVTVGQEDADQWHSVSFGQTITNARVITGPLSFNGHEDATIRLRNVTDSGFEFQIDEWDYRDGRHLAETFSWMAVSEGTHRMGDGTLIGAGRTSAADEDLQRVDLDGFGMADVFAFAQITSVNDPGAATMRVDRVSGSGFDLRMQEEEKADGLHAAETVDWIVFQTDGNTRTVELAIDHKWSHRSRLEALSDHDALIAGMQTINGNNPATLRYAAEWGGTRLQIDEETSRDSETWHRLEDVGVLILETGIHDLI